MIESRMGCETRSCRPFEYKLQNSKCHIIQFFPPQFAFGRTVRILFRINFFLQEVPLPHIFRGLSPPVIELERVFVGQTDHDTCAHNAVADESVARVRAPRVRFHENCNFGLGKVIVRNNPKSSAFHSFFLLLPDDTRVHSVLQHDLKVFLGLRIHPRRRRSAGENSIRLTEKSKQRFRRLRSTFLKSHVRIDPTNLKYLS
mmetsp:Transcript_3407/g.6200  ORF Transcript_3407/g.6200 Transcript_3407/m.6200 type:complete len:201 (-) Transcript_3407:534-1136(-)